MIFINDHYEQWPCDNVSYVSSCDTLSINVSGGHGVLELGEAGLISVSVGVIELEMSSSSQSNIPQLT